MFNPLHVLVLVGPCPIVRTVAAALLGHAAYAVHELLTTTTTTEGK